MQRRNPTCSEVVNESQLKEGFNNRSVFLCLGRRFKLRRASADSDVLSRPPRKCSREYPASRLLRLCLHFSQGLGLLSLRVACHFVAASTVTQYQDTPRARPYWFLRACPTHAKAALHPGSDRLTSTCTACISNDPFMNSKTMVSRA